ncbi:MAG: alpha-L-fucosidase [Lentisphaerae bacterium]|nr:alpha-L-fucosidase [Lentisphaerota bacterium]
MIRDLAAWRRVDGTPDGLIMGRLWVRLVAIAGMALGASVQAQTLADLQQAYVDQGLGLFLHYSMGTYTGEEWASPNRPVDTFAPTALDPEQWAAAAKSAGMTYGVLTTKHHDGFALWDTAQSGYDVSATTWFSQQPPGQGDIVRRFADAFRASGLKVGFYYSIWDRSNGIDGHTLTSRQATDYVKAELTDLLSHYGPIHVIWTDGWGWKNWHAYVIYQEVYDHIKALSPTTLLVENNHTAVNTDIRTYEQTPLPPAGNTFPAELCATIRADGMWFWSAGADRTKSVDMLVGQRDVANARRAAYLLDVTPDARGLIPDSQLAVLAEIGAAVRYRNLALDRPAVQSSTWTSASVTLTADQAVDGALDAATMAHTGVGDLAPWWRVDLQRQSRIDRVVIYNRAGFAGRLRDLTIEVLNASTQAVYTSGLLNPGNVLGGGADSYRGDEPATLRLQLPEGIRGQYVRISRAAEGADAEDQYVLTLPEVRVLALESGLKVTALRHDPATGAAELTLQGEADTAYRLMHSATPDFAAARRVTGLWQANPGGDPGDISPEGDAVVTDVNGVAAVRLELGLAGVLFIRAERVP